MNVNIAAMALRRGFLRNFIGIIQRETLVRGLMGEEKQAIADLVGANVVKIDNMPKTYEQDGLGNQAVAHLHYFRGGMDWYITEKDMGDGDGAGEQIQAFGLVNLGYGPELGYISITELLMEGVEFDLYWEPKTLAELGYK